ncbi:MAG: hypothetical protein ABID45_01645 [Patescibacteria group bacterium]
MRKFKCTKCNKIFESEGEKQEKQNQIYGKTWEWLAKHECGEESHEYIPPKVKSKKKSKMSSSCDGQCGTCPYQ